METFGQTSWILSAILDFSRCVHQNPRWRQNSKVATQKCVTTYFNNKKNDIWVTILDYVGHLGFVYNTVHVSFYITAYVSEM